MKKITRRKFVKTSAAIGGATIIGSQFPGILKAGVPYGNPDIVTMSGNNLMENMYKLLEPIGGIDKYVSSGSKVGVLLNSPWIHPGTYTHPDVALSIIKLCIEAGAKEIVCFKPVRDGYWLESQYAKSLVKDIEKITYCEERIDVEISEGVELNKASIYKGFLEVDVFINIPVAKHHAGTNYSGILKGLMGVSSSNTNRHMHSPDGEYTYSKHEYLSQCIADLNLIRKPDLCIVDATECVQNNGPRGPGETIKPNLILAGTDPVALDVYGANLIGIDPADVITCDRANELGLGQNEMSGLTVMEL
ncbi:MAG: DUF362 domain-containing protein [Bacteroidales bacterium]|nr:DUF362 domain-containing protein [Bacteroidales bacterium]